MKKQSSKNSKQAQQDKGKQASKQTSKQAEQTNKQVGKQASKQVGKQAEQAEQQDHLAINGKMITLEPVAPGKDGKVYHREQFSGSALKQDLIAASKFGDQYTLLAPQLDQQFIGQINKVLLGLPHVSGHEWQIVGIVVDPKMAKQAEQTSKQNIAAKPVKQLGKQVDKQTSSKVRSKVRSKSR